MNVDYAGRYALVVETGTPQRIIAHAAYVRSESGDSAEVAFLVADDWQGKGISTILLAHLAEAAEGHGIPVFTAEVLPQNHRMIDVFRDSGFPIEMQSTRDVIKLRLPTSLSAEAIECFENRERLASIAAVRSFLQPRSVAVIGASRSRATIGGQILHNLLRVGSPGICTPSIHTPTLFSPSRPTGRSGISARPSSWRSSLSLLARYWTWLASAGRLACARCWSCPPDSRKRATRAHGRQEELVSVCRDSGMRVIGPNCLGVLNTAGAGLNVTFAPHPAIPGRTGLVSQSGGLGIAIIEAAGRAGIGLSSFVSVGNQVDLSGNDMLRYWEQDPGTDLALLYLESFGNARKFARIAPEFTRRKPLVAVKSGRSPAGARATSSHTGALLSASDVTVDALFEQAGVIRTDTLHELLDVAELLGAQPVPTGDRVAIVTNAGGPGIMCADACQAGGVDPSSAVRSARSSPSSYRPRHRSAIRLT